MNRGLKGALAAAGLVLGFAAAGSTAKADPITATYTGIGSGIDNAGQAVWTTNGTYPVVYSGPNTFISFCVERSQNLPTGEHTYNLVGADGATDLRSMWAEYRDDLTTDDESAAFQHAIWHLMDANYNPTLNGALAALYSTYLDSSTWQSGLARLGFLTNADLQDQVVEIPPPNVGELPTPAPPTLVVALLIAPALLLRRKLAARGA
jgi:hypothetical protein